MTRFNADGSYAWTQTFGGTGDEFCTGVAISGTTLYLTGSFASSYAQIGGAGAVIVNQGTTNAFVLALDTATGAARTSFGLYSSGMQKIGGTGTDNGTDMAVSGTRLYVSGQFTSIDAQVGGTGPLVVSRSTNNAFVLALDATTGQPNTGFGVNASGVQTFGGTDGSDVALGLAVSATTVYVTGYLGSDNAQIGGAGGYAAPTQSVDGFILALDATTGAGEINFGQSDGIQIVGGDAAMATALLLSSGTLYVTGQFSGHLANQTSAGNSDAFVLTLDPTTGNRMTSFGINISSGVARFGGSANDVGLSMATDGTTLYVAGSFLSTDAKVAGAGPTLATAGGQDAFVWAMDAGTGAAQTNFGISSSGVQTFGGTGDEFAYGIAISGSTLYVAGSCASTNAGLGGTGPYNATGFGGFLLPLDSATGKFAAQVTLTNLNQTYDGTSKSVAFTTLPAGLVCSVTYNGNATSPTNAGTYTVTATVTSNGFVGSSTQTLTIGKAIGTVNLGNLVQTYDGNSKAATATTTPSNLSVNFTYNGSSAQPVNAGSYPIVGTISDTNYQGSSAGTFTINKALVTVVLTNLSQTYDGTPKSVFASTTPISVSVAVTYNGDPTPPTNAGTYTVDGNVTDPNYTGSNTAQLTIGKAAAAVTLSNLSQAFDGTPKTIGTSTNPAGLTVSVTYNGSATAPTQPGSYAVVATISDTNYQGSNSATFYHYWPASAHCHDYIGLFRFHQRERRPSNRPTFCNGGSRGRQRGDRRRYRDVHDSGWQFRHRHARDVGHRCRREYKRQL